MLLLLRAHCKGVCGTHRPAFVCNWTFVAALACQACAPATASRLSQLHSTNEAMCAVVDVWSLLCVVGVCFKQQCALATALWWLFFTLHSRTAARLCSLHGVVHVHSRHHAHAHTTPTTTQHTVRHVLHPASSHSAGAAMQPVPAEGVRAVLQGACLLHPAGSGCPSSASQRTLVTLLVVPLFCCMPRSRLVHLGPLLPGC